MRTVFVALSLGLCLVLGLCQASPAQTPGTLKWKYYNDSWTFGAALGQDGTIYFGYGDGIFAMNPNGTRKWLYETPSNVQVSPAIGPDGTIYAGCLDFSFYAVDPNGQIKWSYQTGGEMQCSPGIGPDGTIYVGSNDKKLYAFRPDGSFKWSYTTGGAIDGSLAIGPDGTIYVRSWDGKFYAVKPDGSLRWTFEGGGYPALGYDGTIYLAGYGAFSALKPDGTTKWSIPFPYTQGADHPMGAPAIGPDGTIYFATYNDANQAKIYALDSGGNKKWEFSTGTSYEYYSNSTPAIGADGLIYAVTSEGKLYAIRPDGQQEWLFQVGTGTINDSPLITPDGTIYLGSNDRYFYAIYSSSLGVAKSPWPMHHRDVRHSACMLPSVMKGLEAIFSLLLCN